jgi:hypothetical protein
LTPDKSGNLYVRDTIEEDAYDTLRNRIRVFEDVVGPLQPILAEMPRILRPGNPPLSLFDARFFLAHGHFIAAPDKLIGDPGVDVDDRE